jgi:di/tricarboxylate transporter
VLMCDIESLARFNASEGFIIHKKQDLVNKTIIESGNEESIEDLKKDNQSNFIELLVLPGSSLIGKTLKQIRKKTINNAVPIAIKKRINIRNTKERLIRKDIQEIAIKPGDRLLVEVHENEISELYNIENVAVLRAVTTPKLSNKYKRGIAFVILLLVIGLAASGLLTILISALLGVSLLLLTRCIELNDVYHKVNWQVIFLLAGMIPLGVAMHNTGADVWVSNLLLSYLSGQSNIIIIGLIFLITMIMSGVVSNNATAVIMTPIAIAVGLGLDLSLKPFILAVLFGANFSFFTPMGYQTNTLIYGMGFYKFKHFLIIGGILSLILWVLGTLILSTLL